MFRMLWRTSPVLIAALMLTVGLVPAHAEPGVAPPGWQPRAAEYGVTAQDNVDVPMSDGTVLKADVIRPAGPDGEPAPGKFPVLVTQTPYNKVLPGVNGRSDFLAQRGYALVSVDVRGTGSSPGTWKAFDEREQRDGAEIVEWAASRPWSNGKVGLRGASYSGINQLFTAARQPKGLKALFPYVPMGDAYRDVVGTGGQLGVAFVPFWLLSVTALGVLPPTTLPTEPVNAVRTLLNHVGGALSFQAPMMLGALAGEELAYDGPFYQQRSPMSVIDKVRVPTFIVGAQRDLFQRSAPLLREAIAGNGVPAKLLFGPGTHIGAVTGEGMPAPGIRKLDELELRWFDHYVRGVPDPGLDRDIAPITTYEQGTGRYLRSASWPLPDVRFRPYRLGPSGTLRAGDTGSGGSDFVPWNPIAGACSASLSQWTAGLAAPALPCEDNRGNDATGATYDLPVRGKPLKLAGPMAAHLTVSTPARDGQLTVRVEDVAPDGTSRQISAGWQTLSLRALDERRSVHRDGYLVRPYHRYTENATLPVPPNTPFAVDIEVFPAAASIAPGHKLRIAVQTADFPHLLPPLPQLANSAGPGVTVWHDQQRPSYVVLPQRG